MLSQNGTASRFQSSSMWCRVDWYLDMKISEGPSASILIQCSPSKLARTADSNFVTTCPKAVASPAWHNNPEDLNPEQLAVRTSVLESVVCLVH